MSSAINFSYDYRFASAVELNDGRHGLTLATSGGLEKNPYFFNGRLQNPKRTADILLTLSAISRTRFFSPGAIRERLLAAADPVVTCDGGQLRFEVFSVCCGVYARFDLAGNALDGAWLSKGTTNVDFNPPMRAALLALNNSDQVGFKIGSDSVELIKDSETVVERKVKLPVRWLRSFVEVQSYQALVKPSIEIAPSELQKLLISLPQQNIMQAGVVTYITPISKGYRLSQRPSSESVAVGAISRLKALEPILRHVSNIKTYTSEANVSAFELTLDEGKFFLVLSPNAARGFSGEGQALSDLAERVSDAVVAKVRATLAWQTSLNQELLSEKLNLSAADIQNALQILGTRGLVGFDISNNAYFHRELPFDLSVVEDLHPRLNKARKLVEQGAVKIAGNSSENSITANVRGESSEYLVQIKEHSFRCTCDWHVKHEGQRGPCSHVLAVELKAQEIAK
ncbi:MAG: zinc finger family protein [Cyanobacteriota bacterium erpe_2018_sw_21hr_WHONDRS-SW48-000092_B_bin.40]|nr:zinc finger family protein [Cyanobacteriota bacterium erpe_2018_sw_21hr_WHONDRS-SW48-000092_B_bin.40]